MSMEFKCPKCAQILEVAESYAGQVADCPACSAQVAIPAPGAATVRPNRVFCQKCGMGNDVRAAACIGCGHPMQVAAAGDGGALSTMIPYKNMPALLGYYFAVFSLIPCLGIPLGIAALILGINGLKKAKAHPGAKGKAHAWVGIVLGGLCALIYTVLMVVGIVWIHNQ